MSIELDVQRSGEYFDWFSLSICVQRDVFHTNRMFAGGFYKGLASLLGDTRSVEGYRAPGLIAAAGSKEGNAFALFVSRIPLAIELKARAADVKLQVEGTAVL